MLGGRSALAATTATSHNTIFVAVSGCAPPTAAIGPAASSAHDAANASDSRSACQHEVAHQSMHEVGTNLMQPAGGSHADESFSATRLAPAIASAGIFTLNISTRGSATRGREAARRVAGATRGRRNERPARKNERGVLSRNLCVSPAVCESRIHGSIAMGPLTNHEATRGVQHGARRSN